MDIRKSDLKGGSKLEIDSSTSETIITIPNSEIKGNKKYIESMIYNLMMEFDYRNTLMKKYYKRLEEEQSYPTIINKYINSDFILFPFVMYWAYKWAKKKLDIFKFSVSYSFLMVLNETARNNRMRTHYSEDMSKREEHYHRYQTLLKNYKKTQNFQDICKNVFHIDFYAIRQYLKI